MPGDVDFKWFGNELVWTRPFKPGSRIMIAIAGTENGPDSDRSRFAEEVLSDLDKIQSQGIEYLNAFVDLSNFGGINGWFLESVEFGRRGDEPIREFVLYYSLDEDNYGLWTVSFHDCDVVGFQPIAFSRRAV